MAKLPQWMLDAIQNVGKVGLGGASGVHSSGPQDFADLLSMYNQSLGSAPTELDPQSIKNTFMDQIKAAMSLGGEQINAQSGDSGRAVRPGGVDEQRMTDLGMKSQESLVNALMKNAFGGLQNKQNNLSKLFESASGPVSNSISYRSTPQDVNSALPPYVRQSQPGGGGNKGSKGGDDSSTDERKDWWNTSQLTGERTTHSWDQPGGGAGNSYWNSGPWGDQSYDDSYSGRSDGSYDDPYGGGGGGGGGLDGLYDDSDQPGGATPPPGGGDEYSYYEIYGPERKGRASTKEAYDAAGGAYDYYRTKN